MFNELAKEINTGVREKGFWKSMHEALAAIAEYQKANNEKQYPYISEKATKDAFISQKIGLIMSECGEALEAMRRFEYEANGYGIGVKDSFADEIADAIIRLLDLCGELNINIDAQIQWKMDYNNGRSEKHGKEF